ncbi:cobyric acid synthase [Methanobrevibacter cuticularis]|uniref:Lipid II isoglutaminyl synthase (glutamine-hydrolyzing) subunit GatD n=2 Tax=Methanobrevibacter cuticularis TaxID=47311 RepID=A0A166CZB2_9EURY|nr:cobyric acid synthase [Methanobrevibacter cuticularis]
MNLKVINMYPDILNLYGDLGNLISIKQRCLWRNINIEIENFTIDYETSIDDADIILVGGGSDNSQDIVSKHLVNHRNSLAEFIENKKVLLAICGSYQMFGNSYSDINEEKIPCLEIFDIETISQENRLIGNIIIENTQNLNPKNIIGFENHGGRSYHDYKPLGNVKLGYGNNGKDGYEGMIYNNFIGSYLHGPILPKNPHLADYIILKALQNKYDIDSLNCLDDSIEKNAHNAIEKKLLKNKNHIKKQKAIEKSK